MKKIAILGVVLALLLCSAGCSARTEDAKTDNTPTMETKSFELLEIAVPIDWTEEVSEDSVSYSSESGATAAIAIETGMAWPLNIESEVNTVFFDEIKKQGISIGDIESGTQGEARTFKTSVQASGNNAMRGYVKLLLTGDALYSVMVGAPSDSIDELDKVLNQIVDSAILTDTSVPKSALDSFFNSKKSEHDTEENVKGSGENEINSSNADAASEPADPTPTASQKNALKKAKSYLNYTAFSYTGLIEQLEYEKFSTEDATYGADNCGADWNEQAAKKAAKYLDYTAFSRDGLIEQLEYEGFTQEQAIYGVDSVGL